MRRQDILTIVTLLLPILTEVSAAQTAAPHPVASPSTFTNFDVPGAQDTNPIAINTAGVITGFYQTSTQPYVHGFLRLVNGGLISFDFAAATSTEPTGINSAGYIAGYYGDAQYNFHGFSRALSGEMVSFDVPGAAGTFPYAVNDSGTIVGA